MEVKYNPKSLEEQAKQNLESQNIVTSTQLQVLPAKPYEKPRFERQKTMSFPEEIWERINGGQFEQTCSRCHHCR